MHQRITRAITTVIRNWLKDLAVLRDACLLTQIVRAAAEDQEAVGIGSVVSCWTEEVPLSSDGTAVVDNHTEIINIEGRRWINGEHMELDESWMGADTVVVDDVVAEVVCATSIISDIGKVTGGVVMEDQGSPSR